MALHLVVDLLLHCNWSKLQDKLHSSVAHQHIAPDSFAIYSDRSYSYCFPFVLAVCVSNPNLETNLSNQDVFSLLELQYYRISGKPVQGPLWNVCVETIGGHSPKAEPSTHEGLQVGVRQTEPKEINVRNSSEQSRATGPGKKPGKPH